MQDSKKKKKLKNKLIHKYILHISEENTMEEKFSLRLSLLNVYLTISITGLTLIVGTILLISFTSLKEYIPGFDSSKTRRQAQEMVFKIDSLQNVLNQNQMFIDNLSKILSGEIDSTEYLKYTDPTNDTVSINHIDEDFAVSHEDSVFRSEIEILDRYSIYDNSNTENFVLMAPVKGMITDEFDPDKKHYAIDMAIPEGTPIVSVADGTVIFAEWTSTTGNVILINHNNNLISVYKHLADRTISQGDFVEAGEVIATSGDTGELSTGPHLHYELWYNGYPVNPKDFIEFEI
jgi:murein DD-endopeptidase MepM/ murein hydrolase activator NlpD